jgi:hypothetical protein
MNKHDWTVLLVRGFGLYLLAHALFSVPTLFVAAYSFYAMWNTGFQNGELSSLGERLRTELITQTMSAVLRILLTGCAGLYLTRSNGALRLLGIPEANSN